MNGQSLEKVHFQICQSFFMILVTLFCCTTRDDCNRIEKVNFSRTDVYFLDGIVIPTRRRGRPKTHAYRPTDEKSSCHQQHKKKEKKVNSKMHVIFFQSCCLFLIFIHSFFFSPLYLFEVKTGKEKERHSETWTNKQKRWQKI